MATTQDPPALHVAQLEDRDGLTSSKLYRWGVAVAHRRRAVLAASLLILLACAAAAPGLQKRLGVPGYTVNGSDSARAAQLIERQFPKLGSESNLVVLHSTNHIASDGTFRAVIASVDGALARQKYVRRVLGPYDRYAAGLILEGEHIALSVVSLGGTAQQRFEGVRAMQAAATRAAGNHGIQVLLTGQSPIVKDLGDAQKLDTERAERVGLPVAFAVLLLALGAVVAALLPLLFAIAALLLTSGVLALLVTLFHFDTLLLAIVTMIGLGIGIDYSLFIVTRFREELARVSGGGGGTPERERVAHAVGVTLATSGRTIIFSGVVVAFSLASIFVVNFNIYREIALGTIVVVVCMLTAAMTLLPAVLALLGARVNRGALPRRLRPADAQAGASEAATGRWARWARLMMRRPLITVAVTTAVLLLLATPFLRLSSGFDAGVLRDPGTVSGRADILLAHALSPGVALPIQIVVSARPGANGRSGSYLAAAKSLDQTLETDSRVTGLLENQGNSSALLTMIASVPIESPAINSLVRHVRDDLAPPLQRRMHVNVFVGGATAQALDEIGELNSKIPLIAVLILIPSLLFLLLALRSIVLPIKAVLMNLLATCATMGLVVWVFQDGHGHRLLDFTTVGFIQFTVPVIMFALLFGLSMDYEVFLIRRVQEEWRKTGDNELAIAAGMQHTARPIMAAAAIMVAVFGSFMTASLFELKQLGFALALAIALDATLIRLVLVPAAMKLLGTRNWWLPAWLERLLPNWGG